MIQVLWLGTLLGAGAALSVGPVFVTIIQTAATRGFASALRVILGSATADLVLLVPALAFAWLIAAVAQASFWVGLAGAVCFLWLAVAAVRDARRLWRGRSETRRKFCSSKCGRTPATSPSCSMPRRRFRSSVACWLSAGGSPCWVRRCTLT
ncbi:LysE family translocator [Streptomyces sp. TS71-3]|uniref:LysE family translocator n=1 Tax=Streptomyces sp. TS71-3 TaxID=2733862 RepID=UPI001B0C1F2B|nr:LysE family transporter [Streptomyces sp. TS71-3]GHJ39212.1 hypothetical protein Sm713_48210 [Streptomyces sp. TS71-3]